MMDSDVRPSSADASNIPDKSIALCVDELVSVVHRQYETCGFKMSHENRYTVLAAFVLSKSSSSAQVHKVISMATGCKCLPVSRLPIVGNTLHDSHAEVLARRGVLRWLYEEVKRCSRLEQTTDSTMYPWLLPSGGGKWKLQANVNLNFYISAVPCGDASIRYLAAAQDERTAALMNASNSDIVHSLSPTDVIRGRNCYSSYGALRTKPGRADSPPTTCMSCSDKIATWNVLGIQGGIGAMIFDPVYISAMIVGGVEDIQRPVVLEDCCRAIFGRLADLKDIPAPYRLQRPGVYFTSIPFSRSLSTLTNRQSGGSNPLSSHESLCWISDSQLKYEVIVNGARCGVPAKQRLLEKHRPALCKISLFRLYRETARALNLETPSDNVTYWMMKQDSCKYQMARQRLKGADGRFSGWLVTGKMWESFDSLGNVHLDS